MSNCKHFPDADDHCLVCEEAEKQLPPVGELGNEIDEEEEKHAFPFWTVAIYLVDQAYGGPEEGGWWYQCGERQDALIYPLLPGHMLTVHTTEDKAIATANGLQALLDNTINVGRRSISSVLSTGQYNAQVHNGHPPAHYPETRPHYE